MIVNCPGETFYNIRYFVVELSYYYIFVSVSCDLKSLKTSIRLYNTKHSNIYNFTHAYIYIILYIYNSIFDSAIPQSG